MLNRILNLLLIFVAILPPAFSWGANGIITVNSPASDYVATSFFTILGRYTLTEDSAPQQTFNPMIPNGAPCNPGWSLQGLQPWDYNPVQGAGTRAQLHYEIDGVYKGFLSEVSISVYGDQLGLEQGFSVTTGITGFTSGSLHTVRFYLQDIYGAGCCQTNFPSNCGSMSIRSPGYITDQIFTFRAGGNCSNGEISACYEGPVGTAGVGICRQGSKTCSNGQWGTCQNQQLPQQEICDGLDNNCNGWTDEGLGNDPCCGDPCCGNPNCCPNN